MFLKSFIIHNYVLKKITWQWNHHIRYYKDDLKKNSCLSTQKQLKTTKNVKEPKKKKLKISKITYWDQTSNKNINLQESKMNFFTGIKMKKIQSYLKKRRYLS